MKRGSNKRVKLRKRLSWLFNKKTVSLFLLLIAVSLGINYHVKHYANKKCYKNLVNIPACKVGIVLGAGVRNGNPSTYLADRLDAAIELYRSGKVQKLLLTGDNGSVRYDEVTVMKHYCADRGVDTTKIYLDYAGFDTYSSLYRAKQIFKVDTAIIVSQNYHLDRAVYLGNKLGVYCYGFAADNGSYNHYRQNVIREYVAVIKSYFERLVRRKPKFLGETVDIAGESNYTK